MTERTGVYPGTFDPITSGHMEIVRRALRMFDRLVIGPATNIGKGPLFTLEERVAMLEEDASELPADLRERVSVVPFRGLLIHFAREQGAQGRSFEGSGIGLSLVHELTRLHGGRVWAESTPGRGSTFVVSLPRGTAHLPPEKLGEASEPVVSDMALRGQLLEAKRWLEGAPKDHRRWEWNYLSAVADQSLRTWGGESATVMSVAYSPDGTRFAEALADGTALVRDADTGEVVHTLQGHEKALWHVAFSPDGKKLATSSADGTAKIWDAGAGRELHSLKHDKTQVYSAAFSPDGKQLASASFDKTVKVWDLTFLDGKGSR